MRAAIYLRQSLDRTGEQLAVERQREQCLKLAEREGWEPIEYVDNDKSASSGKPRPSYTRMLDDIRAGLIGAVIAWDPDRLHRRPIELEHFITLVEQHKTRIAVVNGGMLDLSTSNGRMVARMLGAAARQEIEHKSERQKLAARQRAMEGKPQLGRRAFGWNADGITHNEPEAAALRDAYQACLDGVSLGRIADTLTATGLRTAQQRDVTATPHWSRNSVRQMLLNPRNAGLRVYKGEVMPKCEWQGIVSESTWRAAHALLTDPSRRTSPTTARTYLLTGLMTCGKCGALMKCGNGNGARGRSTSPSGQVRKYVCSKSRHVTRDADAVDMWVTDALVRWMADEDKREALLRDPQAVDHAEIERERDTLNRRLDDLADDYAEGLITREQLRTGTSKLRAKLDALEATAFRSQRSAVVSHVLERTADGKRPDAIELRKRWESLDIDRKRSLLASTLRIVVKAAEHRGQRPTPQSVDVTIR